MLGHSWRFITGIVLLLTNQLVGWGGVMLCGYAARRTGKKRYLAYGSAVYALSWGMVVLGIVLAGPEGVQLVWQLTRSYGWRTVIVIVIVIVGVAVYARNRKKKKVPGIVSGKVE